MIYLQATVDPIPNSSRIEGHGEGIEYEGKTYYYRTPSRVPKDKIVALVNEGMYCGRMRGEKNWIIVAWNGETFVLLDVAHYYLTETMKRFKGLTCEQGIEAVKAEAAKRQADWEATPKCGCGERLIMFDNDQPKDLCLTCFHKLKDTAQLPAKRTPKKPL